MENAFNRQYEKKNETEREIHSNDLSVREIVFRKRVV